METKTTLAPLTIKRTKIVNDLEAALAKQREDRNRLEEIQGEDFDALVAVLTGTQKEYLVRVIRDNWGRDAEDISKHNERQAEVEAITKKTMAQRQDAPLVSLLAVYANVTNEEIELAPTDGIIGFLRYDDGNEDAS